MSAFSLSYLLAGQERSMHAYVVRTAVPFDHEYIMKQIFFLINWKKSTIAELYNIKIHQIIYRIIQ